MNDQLNAVVSALPAISYYPPSPQTAKAETNSVGIPTQAQLLKPWYVSPSYEYDPRAQVLVVQFRNAETGQVTEQIPSEEILDRYRQSGGSGGAPIVSNTIA